MSATGRNIAGNERRADDFYATPYWCTHAILPYLKPGSVLDPCCGEGAILDVISDYWKLETRYGIELHSGRAHTAMARHAVSNRDALESSLAWPPEYQIITNPPYALAEEFTQAAIRRGFELDSTFLLRVNFLGSQRRAQFHRENPSDLYVLPKRPSFTNGGTDATEYAWFVFGPPQREGRRGMITVLEV